MPDALVDDDRRTWTTVVVAGEVYARLPVRTRWLEEGDDLATVLKSCVPRLREDDTVVVSEKVAVLLTGCSVPLSNVRVGETARLLARFVQPRSGSRGLSVPAKMQFVLDEVGWLRLVVAACVSAVTRPVGLRGCSTESPDRSHVTSTAAARRTKTGSSHRFRRRRPRPCVALWIGTSVPVSRSST